jgi:hypothetical protein
MSLVRICDRCHAVIPEGARVWRAELHVRDTTPQTECDNDYCDACSEVTAEALRPLPPAQKEKEPKMKQTRFDHGIDLARAQKKTIDVPGMRALRDAGWTLKQIAIEHGVSEATVSKYLKEEEK